MFMAGPPPHGTVENYKPVTEQDLLNPSPDDWLQYSRTYDAWRYSPLKQINTKNVGKLHIAWVQGLPAGTTETIPIVHDGIIYTIAPGADVMAINGTNGDIIWEYKREFKNPQVAGTERTKALAIYKDMVYYTAPDGYVVALDADHRQGQLGDVQDRYPKYFRRNRGRRNEVISGGTCGKGRDSCFIEADDADTGKESLALLQRRRARRSRLRFLGRRGQYQFHCVHVGPARQLRPGPQSSLLGHCESVAL